MLSTACGQGKVFINLHGCSCAGHRVLKYTSKERGSFKLRKSRHIHAVDQDRTLIHRPGTGDGIEHGGLSGTVTANDSNEIALI